MTQEQFNLISNYLISMRSPKNIYIGMNVSVEGIGTNGFVFVNREDVDGILIPREDYWKSTLFDLSIDETIDYITVYEALNKMFYNKKMLFPQEGINGTFLVRDNGKPPYFVELNHKQSN